jgi:hypothetical protein
LALAPAAQAGAVQDFSGCQANELAPNDDGSTDQVPMGFTANANGIDFSDVFVNNNGNVTVADAKNEYTPYDFRLAGEPIFAPFFADVDTRGANSKPVTYGQVADYGGRAAFCVNWVDVGYYYQHDDKLNSFQLFIVDRSDTGAGNFDLVFNYDTIRWETGDASDGVNGFGGTSAATGYTLGDGDPTDALMAPGSFENGGLLDNNSETSLAGHATGGQPAGRYVYQIRNAPPSGVHLTGIVRDSGLTTIPQAPVQICNHNTHVCITRLTNSSGMYSALNLANGTYDITGFPGPFSENLPTTVQKVINGNPGDSDIQDIELGDEPGPPPAGTTITHIGESGNGVPVVYWDDPLTLTTQGCTGATTATYKITIDGQIVKSGNFTEGPPGTYTAQITPIYPNHGAGVVEMSIDCGGGATVTDFGLYIDPSGEVKDTAGNPIDGATVTLFYASDPAGPFIPVPNGSTVMSPGNRQNAWTTGSDGAFHWDVVAGYYKVRAQKEGCTGSPNRTVGYSQTGALTIPPEVTGLVLTLDCTPISQPPPPAPVVTPPAANQGGSSTTTTTTTTTTTNPAKPAAVAIGKVASLKVLKGKSAVVTVNCLASAKTACSGKVALKVLAKVNKKSKSVAAGSKSFKGLKPGKSLKLTIALSKSARKLGHTKGAKLQAKTSIQDGAGNKQTLTKTIGVKLR